MSILTYLNIFGYLGYILVNMILGYSTKVFMIINQLLIFIVPISLLILSFIFVRGKTGRDRWMFWAGVPFLFFYGIVAFIASTMQATNAGGAFSVAYMQFVFGNWRAIEIVSLVWLTLIFSGLLALRYHLLRKENAQQQLDLEHAALEREREKNASIQVQKENLEKEVAERTAELEASLQNLKSTQAQLIQAEKMASLGELTAGIAHEIQNPLNFVNNFSEVNTELIEELKAELRAGKNEDALAIADDLGENESRINLHGKRADAIVKGMLQHSRQSSAGVKEPTDINNLVDEFLKLAYHGFRTKEKSFHASLITTFDESIGSIPLVSQDIGRVLLNIINNALYAVWQKQKMSGTGFEPTIEVITKKMSSKIQIVITDNGTGIAKENLSKIFQPFFTTKPTGYGTGLGLSLAYDIITKAHGGELKVETVTDQGTSFIIELPVTT
jgi:C4-dicarboxylate-specific signal transduction histidine kinase